MLSTHLHSTNAVPEIEKTSNLNTVKCLNQIRIECEATGTPCVVCSPSMIVFDVLFHIFHPGNSLILFDVAYSEEMKKLKTFDFPIHFLLFRLRFFFQLLNTINFLSAMTKISYFPRFRRSFCPSIWSKQENMKKKKMQSRFSAQLHRDAQRRRGRYGWMSILVNQKFVDVFFRAKTKMK